MKDTGDLGEMAALIHFHVGAWQDFGYAEPPAPECVPIPPLGERSASAIKAGARCGQGDRPADRPASAGPGRTGE